MNEQPETGETRAQDGARRPSFSHSRLSTLAQCPRQYRYRYVDRIAEAFRTVEAFCGQVVHDALGFLYTEREERRSPTADDLVGRFRDTWRSRFDPTIRVVREGATAEDHRLEGERLLRAHHATHDRDRRETLAMESKVGVDVGGVAYTGYIDRLARDPSTGQLHVIDFKTGRPPRSFDDAGLQLPGYGLAILEEKGGLDVALEYDYLRGPVHRKVMTRAEVPVVAGALAERITAALEAERVGAFPARPGRLCAWCGYREICDASGFGPRPATDAEPPPEGAGCPDCGRPLARRSGRRGPFLGCTGYPTCRYSRDAGPADAGRP